MVVKVIDDNRTKKIRQKFGKDAFRKWGKLGGSPILLAYARKHPRK